MSQSTNDIANTHITSEIATAKLSSGPQKRALDGSTKNVECKSPAVGILDEAEKVVRVYKDADIKHVYFNGFFGVSSHNEIARSRRPYILWQRVDFKAMSSRANRTILCLQGEHLKLNLNEAYYAAFEANVLNIHFPEKCKLSQTGCEEKDKTKTDQNATASATIQSSTHCNSRQNLQTGKILCSTQPEDVNIGRRLNHIEAWAKWCSLHSHFPISYSIYARFRSEAWVPLPGLSYGCDFTLYPGDPSRCHAAMAVLIDYRGMTAKELLTDATSDQLHNEANGQHNCSFPSLGCPRFGTSSALALDHELTLQNEWRLVQSAVRIATSTKKRLVLSSASHVPKSLAEARYYRSAIRNVEFFRMEKMASFKKSEENTADSAK